MNKWVKWVLGCCICLLMVCAIQTVVLANENYEMDEVQWLTQRVEDVQRQIDELNMKIDEMDMDYFRDEFHWREEKLISWVTGVVAVVGIVIIAATIIGTWVVPRQTIRATEKAQKTLESIRADVEYLNNRFVESQNTLEKNKKH